MSKTVSAIMMSLLALGALTLAFYVQPAWASGAIYINADGSVDGTTHIQTVDNVTYFLDAYISGYVEIRRDNIILDGNGYMLQGYYGTSAGIYLYERTNVTIQNLNVDDHYYSIFLRFSSNNTISRCKVTSAAIYLDRSSNNIIVRNDIESSVASYNLILSGSDNNSVCENTMNCGIGIYGSDYNNISGNNIVWAGTAILLTLVYIDGYKFSSNNIISGNNIVNSGVGVAIDSTSNNTICHNNFVNNTVQASISYSGYSYMSTNMWDDGYPSGGNYWSDYNGTDAYSGPSQNILGSDEIGDIPYIIDANNTDHYPLMDSTRPITILTIGEPKYVDPVSNVTYVTQYTAFTLEAYDSESGVSFTAYHIYNSAFDGGWQNYTTQFVLDPLEDGNCTIEFYGVDKAGNVEATNSVNVTLHWFYGDINHDGKVSLSDLTLIAAAYGSHPGDPKWNQYADVAKPWGTIGLTDLVTVAVHYGQTFHP